MYLIISFIVDLTVLMIVGGYGANRDVEFIDLSEEMRACAKPSDFPGGSHGSVGIFIDNEAIVCGGDNPNKDCYTYNPGDGTWTLSYQMGTDRMRAEGIIIDDKWWVTGGYDGDYSLGTTELFDPVNKTFSSYTNMPEWKSDHNLVNFSPSSTLLVGGQLQDTDTYIYNHIVNRWTDGPSVARAREESHAGLVTFDNGTKAVIVAGGSPGITSCEILDLETMTWSTGPSLLIGIENGASVQLEDTFIIVGGVIEANTDMLWKFDPHNMDWVRMDQRMVTARSDLAAFLVPYDYCLKNF